MRGCERDFGMLDSFWATHVFANTILSPSKGGGDTSVINQWEPWYIYNFTTSKLFLVQKTLNISEKNKIALQDAIA